MIVTAGVVGLVSANAGRQVTLPRPAYADFSGQVSAVMDYDNL